MKAFTYVSGVWLHQTSALYKLGMRRPEKYGELAINLIKEKILRAENVILNNGDFKKDKTLGKIEKYNEIVSDLVLNIKTYNNDLESKTIRCENKILEKNNIFAYSNRIVNVMNDIDACREREKTKLYTSYCSLDDLIKSHPLFKSQREKLDAISTPFLFLEDSIRANRVFKNLNQEALI